MSMMQGIVEPRHSRMPVSRAADRPEQPAGLSPRTQDLWLAAAGYRRRADQLADADARRAIP